MFEIAGGIILAIFLFIFLPEITRLIIISLKGILIITFFIVLYLISVGELF